MPVNINILPTDSTIDSNTSQPTPLDQDLSSYQEENSEEKLTGESSSSTTDFLPIVIGAIFGTVFLTILICICIYVLRNRSSLSKKSKKEMKVQPIVDTERALYGDDPRFFDRPLTTQIQHLVGIPAESSSATAEMENVVSCSPVKLRNDRVESAFELGIISSSKDTPYWKQESIGKTLSNNGTDG